MMRLLHRAAVAVCLTLATTAANAEWILKSSASRVEAGQPFEIELVLLNETALPIDGTLPDRLRVRIVAGEREFSGELRLAQPDAVPSAPVAPGAFRKLAYTLTLPPDVEGPVTVVPEAVQATPLTIVAQRVAPIAGRTLAEAKPTPEAHLKPVDTQPEPALQTYDPMYFVVGDRGDTRARFQLSFKYRLLDERGPIGRLFPPFFARVYFGYTQTSLWNLSQSSKPFEDTSYKPSLFYYEPAAWTNADGRYNLGVAGGLEHESNGQGGPQSRSINILYVRPEWRAFVGDHYYMFVAPKVWGYLDKSENPDIQRFRGYFDLNLRAGRVDGLQVSTNYRKGTATIGAVQVDVTYPIRRPFFANAGGYLMFQYFNGYGETLLNYNVRGPAQYRLGFAIVR